MVKQKDLKITKRNGTIEEFDLDKIHKVLYWATENITGVSVSEIELRANVQLYDQMMSSDIHEMLIKSTAELINEDYPNYQYVAARLINYKIRKEVYGGYEPAPLYDVVVKNINLGYYTKELLEMYTEEEFTILNSYIRHDRDDNFTFVGMEQMRGKYLVQDRTTKRIFETPQIAFMLISAILFSKYPKDTRLNMVKEFYDGISVTTSLPTPIMAGVRTPVLQFSSCVLIESGDSLNSIKATAANIIDYISRKAGIGLGVGRIRAVGSKIRNGEAVHTGLIPFLKYFQAAVKSCSQGGVRGGAATVSIPAWHYEFEDLVVLRNNKGTENNRVRHLDYCFQFNKTMYTRLLTGGNITLFSPNDVPGLYDSFFEDQDKFEKLYNKYEKDPKIRKKTIPAIEIFSTLFLTERKNTGRVYLSNVDHVNTHGSFIESIAPIRMTNLCVEITLPTNPSEFDGDSNGEIALCTLGAINLGAINKPSDFEKPCNLLVRALDEVLSYQEYPVLAAKNSTMKYRPLGVGIINLAYFLAKRGLRYDDKETLVLLDEYMEAWSYYLIKASVDLAEEKGACIGSDETKYSKGILPMDTRKMEVDELVPHQERMPWDELRTRLKTHGIRNSTLMALMPSETSSQISNATNGIEPPRELVSYKESKDGVLAQVVPGIHRLKNKYDLLWDHKTPEGYLNVCAVIQKWVDQAISVNTSYNPLHFPDNQVPMSQMIKDVVSFYKYGGKNLYYCNTNDEAGEENTDDPEIDEIVKRDVYDGEEDCDSCKI